MDFVEASRSRQVNVSRGWVMKSKNETTALEPTKVVGGAGKKETSHSFITTARDYGDAESLASEFADKVSFYRRRGETKLAVRACCRYLRLFLMSRP